jgi:DegV family protein with EDD domain
MPVAVVTDSTSYLPVGFADERRITVVPLVVTVNGVEGREGIDVAPADVAAALRARRVSVTTSRPSPADFSTMYGELLANGHDAVVSIHLSGRLSGTVDAARLGAEAFADRVVVVDSGTTGMGLGFAVLAAASAAAAAASAGSASAASAVTAEAGRAAAAEVAAVATATAGRTTALFYVDTLEFLRRGGRIGAASALVGTALSVKPILHMVDGAIVARDRVRTAGRALARLIELAVEAAEGSDVDVAVHHSAAPERADALLTELTRRLGDRVRERYVVEAGAAITAHVGPGFAGVVVHRRH